MKHRKIVFSAFSGLGIGFCLIAGKSLDVSYSLDLLQTDFYIKWLACAVLLGTLVHISWEIADGTIRITLLERILRGTIAEKARKLEGKLGFWCLVVLFILMWMPAWLSIFPGVFSYDAYDEWMQICTGNITSHHPVLHVLFLGGIVEGAYQFFGSYNLGIAICSLIQILILAMVLAYTVVFMREHFVNPLIRLFAVFFYGLSPVVQLFAICATKDTLFTAALLLFIISMYRICFQTKEFSENKKWQLLFVISAVFSMIMRNNGKYIVLFTLPFAVLICRRVWRKYLLNCAVIISLYALYAGPFCSALNVTDGSIAEMLSVPLQQIARVHAYEKDTIANEDLEYLYELIDQEHWEAYRSTVSDFVKSGFVEEVFEEDPEKFFKIWVKIGKDHPFTYINSFLINTVDFWYPFAVIDGYQDVYGKSSYFDYRVSEPGNEVVIFSRLYNLFASISHEKETQKLPGIFLVLSPGWYLMLFLMIFLYLWRNKQYRMLIVLLPVLINFGTVLLGPMALVRYVLILFFVLPCYWVMIKEKSKGEK